MYVNIFLLIFCVKLVDLYKNFLYNTSKGVDLLMKNKTSFVVAHRLSTIKDADKILVMKDGKVIEIGKHNELLAQKGFYYNLYKSQFEV